MELGPGPGSATEARLIRHRSGRAVTALALGVVLALVPISPSSADPGSASLAGADPTRSSTVVTAATVRLTPIANLDYPIAAAPSRARRGALFVAERQGLVRRLRADGRVTRPVVDIRNHTSTEGERGLLGIATDPGRQWLYLSYTGRDGASRLERARIRDNGSIGRRRRLLTVAQPASNHNGGHIAINQRGRVFWALGDGGGADDTYGNAQNTSTLLGSILRLRPNGRAVRSNPFVGTRGANRILMYGVRNPWRFSIDRKNGNLWVGDVGQGSREEITRVKPRRQPAANLGWPCWEGSLRRQSCNPPGHVWPAHEYETRSSGCAVTGGHVYRGRRVPGLRNSYVYSDYCDGTIRRLVRSDGRFLSQSLGVDAGRVVSFAEDATRELYVLTAGGTVYRIDAG
jgi:glucose/arabinose dehydrogenase